MLSFKSFSKSQKISGIRHNWHFSSFSNVLQKQYFSPLNLICNKVFIRKKRQFVSIFEMTNFLMKFLLGHFFMFTLHFFFYFFDYFIFNRWKKFTIKYFFIIPQSQKSQITQKKYSSNYWIHLNKYILIECLIIFHVPYQSMFLPEEEEEEVCRKNKST